jgi:hypothetical protein
MSFDGQQIQVSLLVLLPATTVTVGPGVELEGVIDGNYDIDLSGNHIEILQRNPTAGVGFFDYGPITFTDILGRVPAIIGVSVTETLANPNFTPSDVTFDADNIFVDLNGFLIIRHSHPAIMIRYGRGFAWSPAHIRRSVMVSSW